MARGSAWPPVDAAAAAWLPTRSATLSGALCRKHKCSGHPDAAGQIVWHSLGSQRPSAITLEECWRGNRYLGARTEASVSLVPDRSNSFRYQEMRESLSTYSSSQKNVVECDNDPFNATSGGQPPNGPLWAHCLSVTAVVIRPPRIK